MGDLDQGRYPLHYVLGKILGGESNSAQSNIAARSNLELPGIGSLQDAAAALVSGKVTLVPVPVEYGDEITYVDVFTGATAANGPTHSWAALYSPAGVLLGAQSADGGSAAIAASGTFTFTLGAKYIANPTDLPNGFLYVGVSVTATTAVPSLVSGTVPTAVQYQKYTADPPFIAGNVGSALAGTAPASETIASVTAQSAVPIVVLR